jgi:hypothetical protein
MISYCVAISRPAQGAMLLRELVEKTKVPYEILVWMNTADNRVIETIETMKAEMIQIRVVGSTPNDIGMQGYRILFEQAKYEMVAQVDEHVILIQNGIAEKAAAIFKKHKDVKMIVADVIQDKYTDGARPPMDQYKAVDDANGLYDGPVDGWFAIYDKALFPGLYDVNYDRSFFLGSWARGKAISMKYRGLLCTQMKVFYAYGPAYAEMFGTRKEEAERIRYFGNHELAALYDAAVLTSENVREMKLRVDQMRRQLGT